MLKNGKPAFVGTVEPDRTTPLANKFVYGLAPGARISGVVQFAKASSADRFAVEVGCPTGDGVPYDRIGNDVRATTTAAQRFNVTVPLQCNPVAVRLVAGSDLGGAGNEVTVSGLSVSR